MTDGPRICQISISGRVEINGQTETADRITVYAKLLYNARSVKTATEICSVL